jgi:hypothetical protein
VSVPARLGWGLMALFSALIALVSVRYLVPGAPGGAPAILANPATRFGFLTVHAGFASLALAIGSFQFLGVVRRRWPRWHRWNGTLYVVACLLAGSAGLVLSFGTTAGPIATAGFGLLALAWLFTTGNAWRLARARRFAEHEPWMMRSFALTLAAVTLRIYLPLSGVLHLDMDAAYRAISFLCWVPNLAIVEMMIAARRVRTSLRPAAPSHTPG